MCGIVGLFLKDASLEPKLGELLSAMMITMSDRGPDSAGIALYGNKQPNLLKLTLQSPTPDQDFDGLDHLVSERTGSEVTMERRDTHGVLFVTSELLLEVRRALGDLRPSIRLMSTGESIEIYKEVGHPAGVVNRFQLEKMTGTHGIGHTRMATESIVNTLGAHPFSTGIDQCLVHNGSLSNHNSLRRRLIREGVHFETENDSEVAAAYLTHRMSSGATLTQALESGLKDLDGFYTFVIGTRDGFGVMRDPIACKPAVMAETDRYVAFGSEYRALVNLPGVDGARIWEPKPAKPYFWVH
tara:strand:+ start:152 stop:1048 length:897 start_codon:yes stop_codon:yes gene_type:complete